MILLDPDLDPDPALSATSAKKTAAHGLAASKKNLRLASARTLARFLVEAQAVVRLKGEVTVLLTTDAAIRKLNRQFRGKNKATDVLSFPASGIGAEEIAGDLAISVPIALRQAVEQGHSLATEIKVLILHGLLHLAGYDHEADEGKMARREGLLRGRLGLPQGLIERAEASEKRTSGAKARVDSKPAFRGLKAPAPSGMKAIPQGLLSSQKEMSCTVPTGLRGSCVKSAFPTLKRGANKHCASGAATDTKRGLKP
jgi:probable rRNA maturation factor